MKNKIKKILVTALSCLCVSSIALGVQTTSGKSVEAEGTQITERAMADLWECDKHSTVSTAADVPDYLYSNAETGFRVDCKTSAGSTIRYKNPIDVSVLTKEQAFIKILIAPAVREVKDFGAISIRLTDANDENNYVDIQASDNMFGRKYQSVYVTGTANSTLEGRRQSGKLSGAGTGTEMNQNAWYGYPLNYSPTSQTPYMHEKAFPLAFYLDINSKIVYADNYRKEFDAPDGIGTETIYVRDLDKTADMGYGKEWAGFSGDSFYVSITAKDFVASSGTYFISEFMGMDMSQDVVVDVDAPVLRADVETSNLTAVVGKKYPLSPATATDLVDGAIADIQKEVIASNGTKITVGEQYFIPTEAGKHTLVYSAMDTSGNVATLEYTIDCRMAPDPIVISFEESLASTFNIGTEIEFPEIVLSGGNGELSSTIVVTQLSNGTRYEIEDGKFTPILVGEYEVAYIVEDYLGYVGINKEYFEVVHSNAPACSFPNLVDIFIAGKTLKLPEMKSLDYANGDKSYGKDAVVEIYVSTSEPLAGNYGEKLNGYVYTPTLPDDKEESTIYVTYKTFCENYEEEALVKTYPVVVRKMKQLEDNFILKDVAVKYSATDIEFSTDTDGASMQYVTPISSRSSEIVFTIPSTKNNFRVLKLVLVDSVNSAQKVEISIEKSSQMGKSSVYINDSEEFLMAGSFFEVDTSTGAKDTPFGLMFSSDGYTIKDYTGSVISGIFTFSDGSQFTGFDSALVYATFTFEEVVGESAIALQMLGAQPMYANFEMDDNGNLQLDKIIDFEDYAEPIVVMDSTLVSNAKLHEKVTLPVIHAYDGLDPYTLCLVSIKCKPMQGKTYYIYKDLDASQGGISFYADEYGEYLVEFKATDSAGNKLTRSYTIKVMDEDAPLVYMLSDVPQSIEAGKSWTMPQLRVFDELSEEKVRVYLIDYTGTLKEITATKGADGVWTFNPITVWVRGEYTLRIAAYDSNYNYTIVNYALTVV